jgi:hypothetical protein
MVSQSMPFLAASSQENHCSPRRPSTKLTATIDSDQAQAHDQIVNGGDNQPEFTHELAAGGAAYFAAREYEKHCDANGTSRSLRKTLTSLSLIHQPI